MTSIHRFCASAIVTQATAERTITIAVHRRRSMRSIQCPDHDSSAALARVPAE